MTLINNPTLLAFLIYIAWIVLLVLTIISLRSIRVMSGQKKANAFAANGEDESDFVQRLTRVHANCYEHFPIFGGLLLLALALDLRSITDVLAYYWISLRIAQGVIHLISKRVLMVYLRLFLFLVQIAIAVYWIFSFLSLVIA